MFSMRPPSSPARARRRIAFSQFNVAPGQAFVFGGGEVESRRATPYQSPPTSGRSSSMNNSSKSKLEFIKSDDFLDVLEDSSFVQSVLRALPGVNPKSEKIQVR